MQRKVFTINGLSIKVLKINWFWFKEPPGLAPGVSFLLLLVKTARPQIGLLARQSDTDSFFRIDEVIEALSVFGDGELYSLYSA